MSNLLFPNYKSENENRCLLNPEIFSSKEVQEKSISSVINSLIVDPDFTEIFNYFKVQYQLSQGFHELDQSKQLDILAKSFFIIKSQKDEHYYKFQPLKNENEELKNRNTELLSQLRIEKAKSTYEMKCELENLKMKILEEKTHLDKQKEKLKVKNEKLNQKKQSYVSTIEENKKLIKSLENNLEELHKKFNDEIVKHGEEIKQLRKDKEEIESINRILILKNEEFKNRYEILNLNYHELMETHKKMEERWRDELNINFTTGNDGLALDGISINDGDTSLIESKPEKVTCHMKIDSKKLSSIYNTQSKKSVINFGDNYNTNYFLRQTEIDLKAVTENIPENYQVNTIDESSYISAVTEKNFETQSQRGSIGNLVFNDQSFISAMNENYRDQHKGGIDSSFYNSINPASNVSKNK